LVMQCTVSSDFDQQVILILKDGDIGKQNDKKETANL